MDGSGEIVLSHKWIFDGYYYRQPLQALYVRWRLKFSLTAVLLRKTQSVLLPDPVNKFTPEDTNMDKKTTTTTTTKNSKDILVIWLDFSWENLLNKLYALCDSANLRLQLSCGESPRPNVRDVWLWFQKSRAKTHSTYVWLIIYGSVHRCQGK